MAVDPDASVMRMNNFARDGKTQARAGWLLSGDAEKFIEDSRLILRLDSGSLVRHGEPHAAVLTRRCNHDLRRAENVLRRC